MSDNPTPTPNDVRAAMAAQITGELNQLIDQGQITGIAKIPVAATPGPTPETVPATVPAAAPPVATPIAPTPTPTPGVQFDKATHGLGKYNTLDELRQGYFNAVNTLSSKLDELSSLQAQPPVAPVAATVPASVPGGTPRVNPAVRNPIDLSGDPVLAKLAEESSIPLELIAQVADRIATARAEEISAEVVDGRLTPLTRMSEAENYMRNKYPDSVNHINEVSNYLKSNPDEAAMTGDLIQAGKPAKAMEYAFKQYAASVGLSLEHKMVANAAVAEEERKTARAEAGLPTSPNTGVLSAAPSNEAPTREQIQAMNEASGSGLNNSNAATARRRALLGNMLPPSMRTWEQR